MITFDVPGIPAPQGSKTPFGTESNPRTKPWRALVSHYAAEAMNGDYMFYSGVPLDVTIQFRFPRPKSHFRTGKNAHLLRDSAPHFKAGKPDVDKLVRAVLDGCTGIIWQDDAQVATVKAHKIFSAAPGAHVRVTEAKVRP